MSGNEERPYGYPRHDNSERNQMLAAVVVIMVCVGGVAGYLLLFPPTEYEGPFIIGEETPVVEDFFSHVSISGSFASVDVYSYYEDAGQFGYKLHVHTSKSGTYEMIHMIQDGSDHDANENYFCRISICVVYENGTYVEHRIRLAFEAVYHLVLGDITFDFFLSGY